MSNPENPLHNFNNTTIRHMLVAFKYTEDAENINIVPSMGDPGDVFLDKNSKGPAVVIVNEFTESDFYVYSAEWIWNFYGPITQTSSSCIGQLEITDRTGLHFIDFMKTKVLPVLDLSEGHIVFALRTFFIGQSLNIKENDIISGNPLIFNMVALTNNFSPQSGRFYRMNFLGSSTSFGTINQFSKLYQMTITHSDGNLHKEIPIGNVSTCALSSRKNDDTIQNNVRKIKLDKSKPIKTLRELFQAFEVELNQQKFTHSAQLQKWLTQINNNYQTKIDPPIQEKEGSLPIDFTVNLDPQYFEYPVDNRNLPFEQPEQDQTKIGIRAIPIRTGMDIVNAVEYLMKYSRKIGQDSELDEPFIFKTTVSVIRTTTERYNINIVISKIKVPHNQQEINTGPGDGALQPLEFVFQDIEFKDNDIIDLSGKIVSDMGLSILEKTLETVNSKVVYGDREQISSERLKNISFFKTQYSGFRPNINPLRNNGLESAADAAKLDNNINVDLKQGTFYKMFIRGNPFLLFDVNRFPSDVANRREGNCKYYKFPESEPMYVKLTIYLKPHATIGVQDNPNVSNKFYFDNYLHVASITNKFVQGIFYQELTLLRTDDTI